MCVRRSDWDRVTDKEEFVGRLSFESRLPQYLRVVEGERRYSRNGGMVKVPYLMTAMLTGAVVLAR